MTDTSDQGQGGAPPPPPPPPPPPVVIEPDYFLVELIERNYKPDLTKGQ